MAIWPVRARLAQQPSLAAGQASGPSACAVAWPLVGPASGPSACVVAWPNYGPIPPAPLQYKRVAVRVFNPNRCLPTATAEPLGRRRRRSSAAGSRPLLAVRSHQHLPSCRSALPLPHPPPDSSLRRRSKKRGRHQAPTRGLRPGMAAGAAGLAGANPTASSPPATARVQAPTQIEGGGAAAGS
jgi:hypothetical protein